MTLVCPACNKPNQIEAVCSRCGCDLSRLHEIAEAAAARLQASTASLSQGDWPAAQAAAAASWRLCHGPGAARIAFLAAAAAGDTARALRWRERADRGE